MQVNLHFPHYAIAPSAGGTEGILIKYTEDTKLRRVANTSEAKIRIQHDLNKLEDCAKTKEVNFHNEKCKSYI